MKNWKEERLKKKICLKILWNLSFWRQGERRFVILGEGELADIVEMSIKSLAKDGLEFERITQKEEIEDKDALILLTDRKLKDKDGRYLDVLDEIAR